MHSLTSSFSISSPSSVKVCAEPTNTWVEIPAFTSSPFLGFLWGLESMLSKSIVTQISILPLQSAGGGMSTPVLEEVLSLSKGRFCWCLLVLLFHSHLYRPGLGAGSRWLVEVSDSVCQLCSHTADSQNWLDSVPKDNQPSSQQVYLNPCKRSLLEIPLMKWSGAPEHSRADTLQLQPATVQLCLAALTLPGTESRAGGNWNQESMI